MGSSITIDGTILTIGGLVFAIIVAWISSQQMKISKQQTELNKNQVKFFILEKRYDFYDSLMRFIFEVKTYEQPRDESLGWRFLHQKRMAKWLFDEKIHQIVEEVFNKYMEIVVTEGAEKEKRKGWFFEKYSEMPQLFEEYLVID